MLNKVIRKAPLFRGVPKKVLDKHVRKCKVHRLNKGEILIAPGKDNEYLYIALSGVPTVHLEKPDSHYIRIVDIGETVGELSLFGSAKTSAFVVSREKSVVLVIKHDNFLAMVDDVPIIARNLIYILSNWIRSSDQIVLSHQKHIDELELVAKIDSLTGINNRRSFDDLLNRFLLRSVVDKYPLVVIMMDVDNFKNYNDTNGHLGGDQALIALANVLDEAMRPGDSVARFGGEEFSVILPEINLAKCHSIAERLRVAVMNTKIAMPDGTPLPSITISMGIAEFLRDVDTKETLLERADTKLYQDKEEGRNRYCY
jgi:diguanylate cyclase (GGDEF)-like protein